MNPTEIEFALRDLVSKPYDAETFPYDLIAVFNASKMTVSRLRNGTTNKARRHGDVLWQKQLFFRPAQLGEDVGALGDALLADPLTTAHKPRFILVTNGLQVHIRDVKFLETANVEFERLDEQSYFMLPLAGYERRAIVEEHPADIKAAKKLKKLYDAVLAANPTWNAGHHSHELNLLMTRLLFCFYAEDTEIFDEPQIFTNTVMQHTSEDGGDVAPLLDRLFQTMNIEDAARPRTTPAVDGKFPYVNGSLFEDTVQIPHFSRTARRQLLECGDLDWTTINPDIFGSMIQTIAQDGTRSDLGMHYTSVPNIMKVLQPLFLDDIRAAYEKAKDSFPKLEALLGRLSNIRIFDPACGSGNFLVIAYKELRKLEIQTLDRISQIAPKMPLRLSGISLEHFYGIDVVDFACETAKLSLWIAEHQMNVAFRKLFGSAKPTLPLVKITTIHCVNATQLSWLSICPGKGGAETYICGNPPYLGANAQTLEQKADTVSVFTSIRGGSAKIDYVACWFVKLTDYIASVSNASGALVASNSICQGEQVALLWPYVFSRGLCIAFAHTSFKWENSASHNAGVTCIIVGIAKQTASMRYLYTDVHRLAVRNINAYLIPSDHNLIVTKPTQPINSLPVMVKGNEPKDGGHLILDVATKNSIIAKYPEASVFIRRFYGSNELLYNIERYTLWISDDLLALAQSIPPISQRIEWTRQTRNGAGRDSKRAAGAPHRFAFTPHRDVESLVIPGHSSERRQYLQIGILTAFDIASNALFVVYSPPLYLLALLSSRLHRIWAETVGGQIETRIRYSNTLVYSTFPVPLLSEEQKRTLANHSKSILRSRARHPGSTIADLYNSDTMPADLLEAHKDNDMYLETHVYGCKFKDDMQRLEHLFSMYALATKRELLVGHPLKRKSVSNA
jgi:hypothetical protein